MRVLFAAAELTPVARVGGLAEAAAGLVHALRDAGVEVDVIVPDYGDVELVDEQHFGIETPSWTGEVTARRGEHAVAGTVTLVDVPGMQRPHPYVDTDGTAWPDNDHRFMAFAAAIAALARLGHADVVHLNDWHTAAAAGMDLGGRPVMLTIHTLGYQGVMDRGWLDHIPNQTHKFAWYDSTNPIAGAIELADAVVAVSPNYAAEIVTEAAGMGLHQRLAGIGDRLVGIRNGIDVAVWNPATDRHLTANYDAADTTGRAACRADLLDRVGWNDNGEPIIGVVSRLVDQKGIDLLLDTVRFLPGMGARLVVLGAGLPDIADGLAAAQTASPENVWFLDGYDEPLAHQIFAGSDYFVMPSRFEPCGLAQMQAMAYGSIPVVTDVGGLHDTVIDADADRSNGTGFISPTVDAAGLVDALHRAVRSGRNSRRRAAVQRRGMRADWSWEQPAARHIEIYERLISR